MAIDFSDLQSTPVHTGHIDFSDLGGTPVIGEEEPETSILGAAGRGAIGMLPLGKQAYSAIAGAIENKPYMQERQESEKEIETDIANHPIARLAGQAAGVIAPALLTGGTSLPGGALTEGAIMGTGFGAGNAIDTLAGGGSGVKAAGDVALGMLAGGAGGAAGLGLGKMVGAGTAALKNTEMGRRLMTEETAKALGTTIPKGVMLKAGVTAEDLIQQAGKDIDDLIERQVLPRNFYKLTGSINQKVALEQAAVDKLGPAIGADRLAMGNVSGAFPEGQKAINDLVTEAESFKGIDDGTVGNLKSVAANLEALRLKNNLNFNTVSQMRSTLGEQVHSEVPGASRAYKIISTNLDDAMDNLAAPANVDPIQFKQNVQDYKTLVNLIPLQARKAAREAIGTGGGMTNIVGIGGILTGNPLLAVPAVAKTFTKYAMPEAGANIISGGVMKGAADLTGKISGQVAGAAVQQNMGETKSLPGQGLTPSSKTTPVKFNINHPAIAQWLPAFQKAAASAKSPDEVEKSHAITDFTLQQRDPAYAAARKKMAEEPENKPLGMADGGVVPESDETIAKRHALGSTLEGFASQLKNPTHEAKPPEPSLPTRTNLKFHQPFNTELADKLRAFLADEKEKNAESR